MKKRSALPFWIAPVLFLALAPLLISCGKNYYFAGRNLPPSKVLNRVLIAEQNPSALVQGALPFVDAYYDIRHPYNTSNTTFSISGYSGRLPLTIQNLPEEQVGAVFATGDNSFTLVNYATEASGTSIGISAGLAASVFIDRPRKYLYAANEQSHVLSVADLAANKTYVLNLPNVYRVSVNPGGTLALAFVQNSTQAAGTSSCVVANPANNPANNPSGVPPVSCPLPNEADFAVYSIVHLDSTQQNAAANNPNYLGAQDCEPQNLPQYCVFPVSTGSNATFDHPIKAVFSPDGSTVYVLNCGPECGGTTASISVIPVTGNSLNQNSVGASGIALEAQSNISIPGGATNGIFNGNTLYLAGQCFANSDFTCAASGTGDGLFVGQLSMVNTQTGAVSGPFAISDGTHNKMVFADNSTLWIGSNQCQAGEHYKQNQAGSGTAYGCLTMFNTSNNSAFIDAYKGNATGIAAVTGLNKVYTAEGGQIYIYKTTDGSELDNSNVTVSGTAIDVAYMDATSDGNNTQY
ncbi:MAG: hypothetical protein JOZ33_02975 [Acidobacteriaceae bacterium]|nr:hypothetical protein [Acidobacteriaceae bacterium]